MNKQIMKELVPRLKIYSIISFVIDLIIRLLYLIPPILMKKIVDEYIPSNNSTATLRTIAFFAILPVIIAIFTTLYNYRVSVIGRNTGRKIASYGFRNLLNQPLSYFYDKNSVELAEYCSTNATEYILLWITDIPKLCASIIASVVAFAYILSLSDSTGLGLLLYIPVLLIPSFYLSKKAQKYVKKIIVNSGKSKQLLSVAFKNIKFVKTMNLHKNLLSKIDSINKDTVSACLESTIMMS
ncbi:ABC transporter transmembrane domain-containing protein [Proteiniborus sp. MB09-C3]|uniref:ABC transporter transmembrane domain-containing protein n=1 Tax=Proteiniborus sp. MB09-C3 TaxID=3050072 RepID=UPI0025525541|nr:ABC transporter transmembrane domain-containing protein [Proteiniborus sp. MB09-C3]WIV13664.1 ABC transporter transmembrane domain-containing protein [Proteiniborus sp. MB09-C3]